MDDTKNMIVKERIKKLPVMVQNLIYIGNYIEQIKNIRPSHARLYFIYYRYFYDRSINLPSFLSVLLTYNKIFIPAKKVGYFFLNKQYYLPKETVINHLKEKGKIGLEDFYYFEQIISELKNTSLASFLFIVKNLKDINKYTKDKRIKYYLKKFMDLDLIGKNKSYYITSKGWKLIYIIKDMLSLLGEDDLLKELGI